MKKKVAQGILCLALLASSTEQIKTDNNKAKSLHVHLNQHGDIAVSANNNITRTPDRDDIICYITLSFIAWALTPDCNNKKYQLKTDYSFSNSIIVGFFAALVSNIVHHQTSQKYLS